MRVGPGYPSQNVFAWRCVIMGVAQMRQHLIRQGLGVGGLHRVFAPRAVHRDGHGTILAHLALLDPSGRCRKGRADLPICGR